MQVSHPKDLEGIICKTTTLRLLFTPTQHVQNDSHLADLGERVATLSYDSRYWPIDEGIRNLDRERSIDVALTNPALQSLDQCVHDLQHRLVLISGGLNNMNDW